MRLLTLRRVTPKFADGSRAGIAIEIDTLVPDFIGFGISFHTCDICKYVQFHLLFVSFCFKSFIERDDGPGLGYIGEP